MYVCLILPSVTLSGDGFYHCIADVFLGSYDDSSMTEMFGETVAFFGFIMNFYIEEFDILYEMFVSGDTNIISGIIIFSPTTKFILT